MGFLAPWFLGGLAALGVPVFVHLLRRHVTTPRPVGSLMFFERGTQSSTRHRRLRHWFLFLLRFALVLFVVLAFANPFVRRSAASANGRLMLIVVDNSFSMQAGTRFAEAKQEALALVAAKPGAQRAQVMVLGGQLGVLTQTTADAAQLREAITGIEQGDGRANFGELGRGVRRLGETVREPIDVHLFSDMQRSAMAGNFAEMVVGERATLLLHPVADRGAAANWTVESVDAPGQIADLKDPKRSRVRAVVAGYGTPAVQQTVDLLVNGKVTATRKVTVPANGRGTVEFAPLDVGYGFNRCEVRVEGGDAFPGDDGYVFAVRRSEPEKVLFVHPAGETRSALYFGAALGAAAQSSFVLQQVAAEQTADLDPGKFAFVVLSDAEALPTLFERALERYVAKGGSVLLALGTGAGHRGRLPLWPSAVKEVRDYARAGGSASVGEVDFTHPAMLDAQPGPDNGGWAGTKVFYASAIDPAGARVAARLSDGTPLVIDRQAGEGHVMLLATGVENLTNDLPLHPVFVAFVDRTARYLSGDERLSGSRVVDAYVPLRAEGEPVGELASVQVAGPAGSRPLSLGEARTARTLKLERAGFYQIHLANGRDAVIGVNPDRRESDLTPMPEDLQRLWSGSATRGAGDGAVAPPVESRMQPVSLWWWVMLLAVVAALAESVVATGYMGTQREEA